MIPPSLNVFKKQPKDEKIVEITESEKIKLDPIWNYPKTIEGKEYQEYMNQNPSYNSIYTRETVHGMLKLAATFLPKEIAIVAFAAHRPIEVQKKLINIFANKYIKDNTDKTGHKPTWEEAINHARTYVADPDVTVPPHCCGAALDVQLKNLSTNKYLDFGSEINLDDEISFLHSKKVSEVAYSNRMLLLEVMLKAGFASYYYEWWHYSYGDQTWAWFYNKDDFIYDLIDH